jgi:hypothetical protein
LELRRASHAALHRRRGRRILRLNGQAVPFGVAALLWAGAAVGHLAGVDVSGSGTVLTFSLWAAATLVWWVRGARAARVGRAPRDDDGCDDPACAGCRRKPERNAWWVERGGYLYTFAVTCCASVWLLWACPAGAGGWRAVLLWVGAYAVSAPYWARHRIPDPPPPADPPEPAPGPGPPAVAVDRLPPVVELWNDWVACKGGLFEGSELTDGRATADGEKWAVRLVRERKQTREALQRASYGVAAAMGMSASQVAFDRHPDGEHLAYLLVTTDLSAAGEPGEYPGPQACYDPATGDMHWGRWPDGQPMPWHMFHPVHGAQSGVILGASGAGKSRIAEQLACTAMGTRLVVVWMIDPQDGSSLPMLKDAADWAVVGTGGHRIGTMLRAVDIVGKMRTAKNSYAADPGRPGKLGRKCHPATGRMPALVVVIDESHMVFDKSLVGPEEAAYNIQVVDRIATAYRKAQIGCILLSQHSGIEVFGGNEKLRSNVVTNNAVVMQLTSNIAGTLIPTFDSQRLDARKLPRHGFSYYCGPGGRDVPGRSYDAEPTLAGHFATVPTLSLEGTVQKRLTEELGDAYADRRAGVEDAAADHVAAMLGGWDVDPAALAEIAEEDPAAAAGIAQLAESRAGKPWTPPVRELWIPPWETTRPAAGRAPRPAERTTSAGNTLVSAWTRPFDDDPGEGGTGVPPTDAPTGRTHPSLSTVAGRDVYATIPSRDGEAIGRSEIMERLGYSRTHVHRTLNALADDGLIARAPRGGYTRTA